MSGPSHFVMIATAQMYSEYVKEGNALIILAQWQSLGLMDPKEMKREVLRLRLCGSNSDQWLIIITALIDITVLWEEGSIIAS